MAECVDRLTLDKRRGEARATKWFRGCSSRLPHYLSLHNPQLSL